MEPEDSRTGIDPTVPHSARIWNYWLGGNDNYPVDREAGDAWLAVEPEIAAIARSARAFLQRGVRYLAEVGVRQFLDIGTGLPTADNTHEVAQRVAPESAHRHAQPGDAAQARERAPRLHQARRRDLHAGCSATCPPLRTSGNRSAPSWTPWPPAAVC
ncbi:SAM-dependent methyltransferase [Pseudonocardia lacus]|uniref:SAM-dependent methyltransferase n=1 Tax=Pseudonocardia lacus TaxID=2835865 RepID=UPI0020293B40|nr:SAM-dependent methyltransferase [Pseudonocardia lacus]